VSIILKTFSNKAHGMKLKTSLIHHLAPLVTTIWLKKSDSSFKEIFGKFYSANGFHTCNIQNVQTNSSHTSLGFGGLPTSYL